MRHRPPVDRDGGNGDRRLRDQLRFDMRDVARYQAVTVPVGMNDHVNEIRIVEGIGAL